VTDILARHWRCDLCGKPQITEDPSEAEVWAEYARNFPDDPYPIADAGVVCDACYEFVMVWSKGGLAL
jgi:hypothetical protein